MPKRSALKLTERIVERLKVDGKDALFRDRGLAGLGVRVHTTKRNLYIVQTQSFRRHPVVSAASRNRRCGRSRPATKRPAI